MNDILPTIVPKKNKKSSSQIKIIIMVVQYAGTVNLSDSSPFIRILQEIMARLNSVF